MMSISVVATPICVAAATTPKPNVATYASVLIAPAFDTPAPSSAPCDALRATPASHANAPRMKSATSRFGMNPRTMFTTVLIAVRWTASAAMRMNTSRAYHFTNPAMMCGTSAWTCARWSVAAMPERSAATSTRASRSARSTSPATAPEMIQPSTSRTSAARIAGNAANSAMNAAAMPVNRAVPISVTGAGMFNLAFK